jgi:hypothetical protein
MQIISGRMIFSRTVQPAQYESKKAEVELNFVLAENELNIILAQINDVELALKTTAGHAMDVVLQMVGLQPTKKTNSMPTTKPVITEIPEPKPANSVPTTMPEACITAEQMNQLSTLITATATDVDKLMEHLGHKGTELHSLPADKFDAALAALNAKKVRMAFPGPRQEVAGGPQPQGLSARAIREATQTAPQQENAPAASARKPRADAGVPRGPRTRKDGDAVATDNLGPQPDRTIDTPAAQEQPPPERPEQFPEPYIQQSAEDYVKYVENWITAMGTDAAGMIKRWNNERDIRNSLSESIPTSELTRLRSLIGASSGADRKVAS